MTNKLAHFTKIRTLFCDILPKQQLRASNLIDLNDPLENKWDSGGYVSYRTNISINDITPEIENEYYEFYSKMSKKLGHHINIACFSSYNHYLIERMQFSAPHENLKMWSQYGDSHQGACLIINKDNLLHNINNSSLNFLINQEVFYENNPNSSSEFVTHTISDWSRESEPIDSFFHRNAATIIKENPGILFKKRIEWRDELEERFIFYEKNAIHSYLSIENAIEEIIFGIKTPSEYISSINIKYPHIKLSKMTINRSNKIEIEKI